MNNDHDVIDAPATARDGRSGRATWDSRGNSVWEWQTAPGVYSRNADTQRVRALQVADLELLEAPAPEGERVFAVSPARTDSSRAGVRSSGNKVSPKHTQRVGLIKRLMGR